jgi:ankyrin repeat protein
VIKNYFFILLLTGIPCGLQGMQSKPTMTDLKIAIWKSNPSQVKNLIEKGIDINKIIPDADLVPLTFAIRSVTDDFSAKKQNVVKLLVNKGANINKQDKNRNTPLHYLCTAYTLEEMKERQPLENWEDDGDILPTEKNIADMMYYLVSKGADMSIVNNLGHTPYYYLDRSGSNELEKNNPAISRTFNKQMLKKVFADGDNAVKKHMLLSENYTEESSFNKLPGDMLNEIKTRYNQLSTSSPTAQLMRAEREAALEEEQQQ